MKPWLWILPSVVAFGIGWWLGHSGAEETVGSGNREAVSSQRVVRPDRPGLRVPGEAMLFPGSTLDGASIARLEQRLASAGPDDFASLLKEVEDAPLDGWDAIMAKRMVFSRWAEVDPDAALAAARELSSWEAHLSASAVLRTVATLDPARAWAMVEALGDAPLARQLGPAVLQGIAETDPRAAFEQARSMGAEGVAGVIQIWAKQDPKAAFEAAQQLTGSQRNILVGGVFGPWFRDDPEAAEAAFDALDPMLKLEAGNGILREMAKEDPAAAAAWATERLAVLGVGAGEIVCEALAREDPRAAMDWAQEHLDERSRTGALRGVFEVWINEDFTGATEWLTSLERAPDQKQILGNAMWGLMWQAPELATELIGRIGEEQFGEWELRRVGASAAGRATGADRRIAGDRDCGGLRRRATARRHAGRGGG